MKITVTLCISLLVFLGAPCTGAAQDAGRQVSFRFTDIGLRASLDSLMKWYPVSIVYLDKDVEGRSVSASCVACNFENALNSILSGTSLMWIRIGNQVILRVREMERPRPFATICGTVTDSLTGEMIVGASVLVKDSAGQDPLANRRWCPTNSFGFYSLRHLSPGTYSIVVRALGYQSVTIPAVITDGGSVRQDFGLKQEEIAMEEVTVEGRRTVLTSAEGFSRGIYIRSVPSDQNQYILDGARIYNPAHFGEVLSSFNPEVLNDVETATGGMPPYYGGRIGGILDLSMRDGTMERLSGSAGTGSLGSHLLLEGPLAGGTTFLLSGRRGYPDVSVPFLQIHGTPSRLGSSELVAKLSHRLSGSSRLFLSGFLGMDSYNNQVEGRGERLNNNFSWGNRALNLRWIEIAAPSLFLQASAVYTRYDFSLEHSLAGDPFTPGGISLTSDFAVEDVDIRAHAEHYYDEEHTLRGGVELVHHGMTGGISEFSTQTARLSLQSVSSWELSVYLQDQWRILPRVMAEIGGRATNFTGESGSFSAVDPRFSLFVSVDEGTRLYSSLTSINQFIHPYRYSGVFLFYPTIFWYPSSEKVKPSTSLQVTLGVEKEFGNRAFEFSAESYYRITHNLHEFGIDTTVTQSLNLNDVIFFGTGRSYGVVFALRKRAGDLSGSISYTLSWGSNTFAELNRGESFAPRFDRRHEVQIDSWYRPGDDWVFGFLCVLAADQSPSLAPRVIRQGTGVVGGDPRAFGDKVIELNGSRLPGFQRLELSVLRRLTAWGLPCQLSLRLLNGYGLLDPFVWELQNSPDLRSKWTATLQEVKLFPLYPTVGLTVRF